jgi:hypothetical protein
MDPWYKVVTPREELRQGRSLDPSEFAVHLQHVADGTAPRDYVEPEKFFARNYFSQALVEHCGMALRRLNGETANTAPVLSLITQFGGGKTHTLTTLYHLAQCGDDAQKFAGVADMMKATGLAQIPKAKVAIFVGNSWGAQPGRETPWMDIADQLAGDKGRALFGKNAPGTKAIEDLFRLVEGPVLILFDETLNYVGRHPEQLSQFHSFMQNLTVALTSAQRAVGLFSLPSSPTEMTEDLREWRDKLTKIVGRVGKDLVVNDASEVSEIVRRRLFEDGGRESMKRAVSRQFAGWVFDKRDRLPPEWGQLSEDQIRAQFEACYPFHPATLTVFQRKWQALSQFQQTRTTLAMLGLWISCAYRDGYGKARREPLLTLGSAPLGDREFLSAVLRQMGSSDCRRRFTRTSPHPSAWRSHTQRRSTTRMLKARATQPFISAWRRGCFSSRPVVRPTRQRTCRNSILPSATRTRKHRSFIPPSRTLNGAASSCGLWAATGGGSAMCRR